MFTFQDPRNPKNVAFVPNLIYAMFTCLENDLGMRGPKYVHVSRLTEFKNVAFMSVYSCATFEKHVVRRSFD